MTSPRIWFITGANRGIGLEIARAALAAGDHVVATARRKQSVIDALGERDDVLALALDVTDKQQIAAAVDAATTRFGRIDILVNNAGYGHLGLFEQTTDAEVRMQFNTNVFGLMDVTRAVLPVMRAQRSGHVLNLQPLHPQIRNHNLQIFCWHLWDPSKIPGEMYRVCHRILS